VTIAAKGFTPVPLPVPETSTSGKTRSGGEGHGPAEFLIVAVMVGWAIRFWQ